MDSTTPIPELVAAATLMFRVGGHLYGCDIRCAQEMVPFRPTTRLPGAPSHVRGLINVRGTVVTVLDLANRFDPARRAAESGTILLVRYRERLVGMVVDEVVDVRTLDVDTARADDAGGAIVRGVAMTVDGAVVVLDLDSLIRQVLLT